MRSEVDAVVGVVHADVQLLRGAGLGDDALGFVAVEGEVGDQLVVVLQLDHGVDALQLAQRADQNHRAELREELGVEVGLLHPLENGEETLDHVQRVELVLDHVVERDQLGGQIGENVLGADLGEENGVLGFSEGRERRTVRCVDVFSRRRMACSFSRSFLKSGWLSSSVYRSLREGENPTAEYTGLQIAESTICAHIVSFSFSKFASFLQNSSNFIIANA